MSETFKKIDFFWEWFYENHNTYDNDSVYDDKHVILSDRLGELGIDSWEIGRDDNGRYLAISPAGSREKLSLTRKIVALSPNIPGWHFLAAKPPKNWTREFEWTSDSVHIDAKRWRFVIYQYSDGLIDLIVINDSIPNIFSDNVKDDILFFVVESEIGEELLIELIRCIEIDTMPTDEMRRAAIPISGLKASIEMA